MILEIHPDNPDPRKIIQVIECLKDGGVIIYPTDTIYGLGCDIYNYKAILRIAQIKGVKAEKANFSFICYDLSHISNYTKNVDTPTYKVMRKALPGPFTFILQATARLPKPFKNNKKTVGIRIPNHQIPRTIVRELGNPILTTSIHDVDEIVEYTTDPSVIYDNYKDKVDIVIDGGIGNNNASTVVDCTNSSFDILRQGMGDLTEFL